VLIGVDGAQWLDDASRDALAFAVRRVAEGPLSLLVAGRAEAAADPLTAGTPPPARGWHDLLDALPATEVLDLAPLEMWQIQNLLPPTVSAAQAQEVTRQSRGNPFWAKEIAASLGSGYRKRSPCWTRSQIPPRLWMPPCWQGSWSKQVTGSRSRTR